MEGFPESTGEDRRPPSSENEAQEILKKIRDEKGYKPAEIEADMTILSERASNWIDTVHMNYRKEQSKSTRKLVKLQSRLSSHSSLLDWPRNCIPPNFD